MFEYNKVTLLVAAATVVAVLAPSALAPGGRRLLRDPLRLGIVLFMLSAVVSTVISPSPWLSILGAHESFFGLLTLLAYAVLFFATRALCETVEDARWLALAPVVAAGVAATYAVVQVAGLDPILYARTSDLDGHVRPFATLGHPNFLAAFLAMALPLVIVALDRALRNRQPVVAAVFALIAALSGVAIAVAVSRGAWLAVAAAAVIFVAGTPIARDRRAITLTAAVAGVSALALGLLAVAVPAGGLVASGLGQRLRHFADSAGRQHIWQAAWGLFRDHPLTGTGLDTFQIAFAAKRTPAYWAIEWNASPARAHNEALDLLATQGALGGVAMLVVVVGALLAVRRALRGGADRTLVVALAAGMAAFAVQDLFSFTVAACGTLVVTQAALLSRLAEPSQPAPGRDGLTSQTLAVSIATLVAIAVLALNLSAAPLLDEPARVIGGSLVLLALLAAAAAVFALEQHGRASVLAERAPSRPAARAGDRSRVAVAARWAIGAVLLAGLVVRPFAAARAAHRGVLLTPEAPAVAVRSLDRAVALEPFSELYWVKLGEAEHALARASDQAEARRRALERARTAYERAARLVPANSYDHANVGRVLADLARDGAARPADALAAFDRALAMDPNNAYFYVDAANAALAMDDVDHAQAYAARGAARYPRFAIPSAQLGHLAMLRGRPAEAVALLRGALDGDWHGAERGRAGAASNLAAAWLQLGKPAEATAAARLALSLAPGTVEARFNLGKALEAQGRRAEAIEEYRRLLQQRPDYEPALSSLRALGAS